MRDTRIDRMRNRVNYFNEIRELEQAFPGEKITIEQVGDIFVGTRIEEDMTYHKTISRVFVHDLIVDMLDEGGIAYA